MLELMTTYMAAVWGFCVMYGLPFILALFAAGLTWLALGSWTSWLINQGLDIFGVDDVWQIAVVGISVLLTAVPAGVVTFVGLHGVLTRNNHPLVANAVIKEPSIVDRFTVVEIDPPKHMYVTVKRDSDGAVFGPLYVSKHCSYDRSDLHSQVNLIVHAEYNKNTPTNRRLVFENLHATFCGQ